MEDIEQSVIRLRRDVMGWEEVVFNWACSLAQEITKGLLESRDEELMKKRNRASR
jgi:hypothetical protein